MSYFPNEALRISGVLYLLKRETGIDVVQQEEFVINDQNILGLVKDKKIPETLWSRFRHYSEKNKQEKSRYHEGLFYDLCLGILDNRISDSVFLSELRDLLFKEQRYIEKIDFSRTTAQFKFPVHPEKMKEGLSKPVNDLNMLDFKKHKFHEGVFITGITGIGKSFLGFSLFEKNIMEGGGGLYFSTELDHVNRIYSFMKNLNREDDLMIFSSNDYKDLLKKDLKSLAQNNKVVLFYFNGSLSFFNEEKWLSIINDFSQYIYIKSQDVLSTSNNFMIVFDEFFRHMIKYEEMFKMTIRLLQERKVILIFVEQHFYNLLMEGLQIKNRLFMKQHPEKLDTIGKYKEELSSLKLGEVCYIKCDKNKEKMVDRFCIDDVEQNNLPDEWIYYGMW